MRVGQVQAVWASGFLTLNAKETEHSALGVGVPCCEVMSCNLEQDDSGFHAEMRCWMSGCRGCKGKAGRHVAGSFEVKVSLLKTFLQKSSPLIFLFLF